MPDLPTFTNGGLIVVLLILAVLIGCALLMSTPEAERLDRLADPRLLPSDAHHTTEPETTPKETSHV